MDGQQWRSRRGLALLVRLLVILLPLVAGVMAGVVAALAVRSTPLVVQLAVTILVVAVAVVVVERIMRRLAPLAALLELTLIFPDRAPSRFRIALVAGTVTSLRSRIERAERQAKTGTPGEAASVVVELAAALSAHDRRTRGHSERVRAYSDLIAEQLRLPEADRQRLRWGALLHDIGKLLVDPDILNKRGSLTDAEWEVIRRHPIEGARLAQPLKGWLGDWMLPIEQHHERWDGGGYPYGLAENQVSLAARIVGVADAFDVMTSARTYGRIRLAGAARAELVAQAGAQFDPAIVRAFLGVSLPSVARVLAPLAWFVAWPLTRSGVVPATLGAHAAPPAHAAHHTAAHLPLGAHRPTGARIHTTANPHASLAAHHKAHAPGGHDHAVGAIAATTPRDHDDDRDRDDDRQSGDTGT